MKPTRHLLVFAFLLGCAGLAPASGATIWMRISVKFITSASGALPCCGNGTFDSFSDITNQVNFANEQLRATGRGYQFQIWEVTTVGGPATNFYRLSRDDKDLLELAAETSPAEFKWRSNAINLYVNDAAGSAICSFPPDDDIILFGQESRTTSLWHESGHYFNLAHTHSGQRDLTANGSACTNECACAQFVGGNNDSCPDTIQDHTCWDTANAIAQGNYGLNYAVLSAGLRTRVDNVFNNIMSYHDNRDRMTSDQLDRWTDAANDARSADVSGRTRFVDRASDSIPLGTSAQPWQTVAIGIGVASPTGSDIVLIRPGNYNEPMTITKPVTLRATRGDATIGLP